MSFIAAAAEPCATQLCLLCAPCHTAAGTLLQTWVGSLAHHALQHSSFLCFCLVPTLLVFSPRDVLLRTQLHIPGERAYTLPMDLVWDTTRGWTAGSLRQRVADFYSLPVEKIEIAKYFPEKFEWLPISSWVS